MAVMQRRSGGVLALAAALALALAPAADAKVAASAARSALPAFGTCKALLNFAKAGAHRTDGRPGVPPRAIAGDVTPLTTPAPQPMSSTAEGGAGPGAPQPAPAAATPTAAKAEDSASFSGTNNQETDVDEPDLLKTDGRTIIAVTDQTLQVLDVSGASPALVGQLRLEGYGHQLLWRGDSVLVIAKDGGFAYPVSGGPGGPVASIAAPYPGRGKTIVTEVSIADKAKPVVKRTMTIDGDFVDARQNGGTARLVIDSAPDPIQPEGDQTADDAVNDTTATDYLGGTVLRSNVSGRTFNRQLVKCNQVRHPRSFSGLDVLTIMTVDLDKGLYSLDRDGIMAGAQVVYGSDGALYVASNTWSAAAESGRSLPRRARTEIHKFDISDPDRTTYAASGTVDGYILNQYAMSEYQGHLRVASTEDPLWFTGSDVPEDQQQSGITVLKQEGTTLRATGRIRGLGINERIYATRFLGDRGYVVTFRQMDPLYVLDLADPARPVLKGELELPGFSSYLHPVGGDRLLGIGQSGSAAGAAASLFDVSDPAAPKRVSQLAFGNGSFQVANDFHAFLYWGATKLAVLPLSTYAYDEGRSSSFTGAVGLRVGDALSEVGRVTHPANEQPGYASYTPTISRALVIGDAVYTLSYAGIAKSTLSNLAPIGFTPLKAAPVPQS